MRLECDPPESRGARSITHPHRSRGRTLTPARASGARSPRRPRRSASRGCMTSGLLLLLAHVPRAGKGARLIAAARPRRAPRLPPLPAGPRAPYSRAPRRARAPPFFRRDLCTPGSRIKIENLGREEEGVDSFFAAAGNRGRSSLRAGAIYERV